MSDTVTISLNELRALLRKAFEGVYGHDRDWNAMAETVLWLETRGLDGMQMFFESYAGLSRDKKLSVQNMTKGKLHLDLGGGSCVESAHLIGDVVLTLLSEAEVIEVTLSNASLPKALLILEKRFERFGHAIKIYDGKDIRLLAAKSGTLPEGEGAPLKARPDVDVYKQVLDNGISLDQRDFKRICDYAEKVLVPASELSRMGAGA